MADRAERDHGVPIADLTSGLAAATPPRPLEHLNLSHRWREPLAGGKAAWAFPEQSDLAGRDAPASLEGTEHMNRIQVEDSKKVTPAGSAWFAVLLSAAVACSGYGAPYGTQSATIGPKGGELVGAKGSALDGVKLTIPAGALASDTRIEISPSAQEMALPSSVVRSGPQFAIGPAGTRLALPAQVTLPFDEDIATANDRFDDEVDVWVREGGQFAQRKQVEGTPGSVTVDLSSLDLVSAGLNPPVPGDVVRFDLHPNPQFLRCLAQFPGDAQRAPSVEVTVVRGEQNDGLFLRGRNIKPGLAFDLFTVEHTNLAADATVDPAFRGAFGLASYQSDLAASDDGRIRAVIRTILLDEGFSLDPGAGLAPTGTFNVGFWFDDPNAAVDCGFNPLTPTPFNGEHKAGPLAMISTPDASTGLGPLCTHPDTSTTPARCSP